MNGANTRSENATYEKRIKTQPFDNTKSEAMLSSEGIKIIHLFMEISTSFPDYITKFSCAKIGEKRRNYLEVSRNYVEISVNNVFNIGPQGLTPTPTMSDVIYYRSLRLGSLNCSFSFAKDIDSQQANMNFSSKYNYS